MPISVISTGTPEVADEVGKLADELLYAMGQTFDLARFDLAKSDLIVLNVYAIAPHRGSIPDGISFKRADREFWSSRNIDFLRYEGGDLATKIDAVGMALIEAFEQVPRSRASNDAKQAFRAAVSEAGMRLQAEPDRLTYRQR